MQWNRCYLGSYLDIKEANYNQLLHLVVLPSVISSTSKKNFEDWFWIGWAVNILSLKFGSSIFEWKFTFPTKNSHIFIGFWCTYKCFGIFTSNTLYFNVVCSNFTFVRIIFENLTLWEPIVASVLATKPCHIHNLLCHFKWYTVEYFATVTVRPHKNSSILMSHNDD